MFAVIFEVQPKDDRRNDYFDLAKVLKPKLEATDGFIDIDRLDSRRTAGRVLSLSIWRDEKSVIRWRTDGAHHGAQQKGRFEIFADYRLRVGEIIADTHPPAGLAVAQTRFDATEIGEARAATITELTPEKGSSLAARPELLPGRLGLIERHDGLVDHEVFASIYNPGKLLLLASWREADAAARFRPEKPDGAPSLRHRGVRIIRDYGMFDRREAPQFYPAVPRAKEQAA